ncbi:tyrosine-type recombinase/integrase [Azoarcus olearius]|uniref:Site-specific recombinase, phage integrase family n=1 Tax=Azoarcus sp. (strain BH72) TaxID=418699 RepID=A1K763_AZOSB|nr:integrase family protein [Azoarcus olearius]CAL94668.1 site-specific recombinase, phage integrase family [Azoarcus olearius]
MTFDARALKVLPVGEHLTSPDFPGLRLVATSRGKAWIYRYKSPVDGRMRQTKVGQWPAMSVHAAVAEWERLREARGAGADAAVALREERERARQTAALEREAAKRGYTVAKVCDDYFLGYVRLARARKGANEVRRMFDKMLGATAGVLAASLTRAQAFDLINGYAATAPVQAKKLRAELGAAWDYAIDAGRLPDNTPNWWRQILRGKIRSKGKKIAGESVGLAKRVLSSDEVGVLIRWLPNFTALVEDVLTLYLWTGARGSEICAMRGDEVTREADGLWWWTVPKVKTKNARHDGATDLRVPLFGRAVNAVLRRKERFGDSYLFPARTRVLRPVEQKTIQVAVHYHQPYSRTTPRHDRPRLPVTRWGAHDLRRTARTLLASLGCPDAVGEAILGHTPAGILGIYNRHTYDRERVEWLKRLSDHLEDLARLR